MNEVRCEFHRGGRLESVHHVSVCAVRGTKTILKRGAVGDLVWMRSCAKPFQTLTVVESGAAVEN